MKWPHTRLVVALTYTALLVILSSIPERMDTGDLLAWVSPKVQQLLHGAAYGILVLLWILTLRAYAVAQRRSTLIALALASGCGVLTEIFQTWVPGRVPSVSDFVVDMVGILLGSWLYWRSKPRVAWTF